MATLKMQVPGKGVKVYRIHKKITSLGRSDEADVTLPDPTLADSHVHIHFDGRDFNLATTERDAEVFVNGKKKRQPQAAARGPHPHRRVARSSSRSTTSRPPTDVSQDNSGRARLVQAALRVLAQADGQLRAAGRCSTSCWTSMIAVSNADKGFLVLMESGEPVVKVARNLRRETISDAVRQLSDSILAHVIKTHKPLIISDALNDDEFKNSLSVVNLKLTSVMCVPLLERGNMLGVIYVGNDNVAQLFDESHLEVLTVFAAQASLLVRNALLVNELKLDNRSLHEPHRADPLRRDPGRVAAHAGGVSQGAEGRRPPTSPC